MRERIAEQKVAVFIVNARNGHREWVQKGEANDDDAPKKNDDGERPSFCEAGERSFYGAQHSRCYTREQHRDEYEAERNEKRSVKFIGEARCQCVKDLGHRDSELAPHFEVNSLLL